MEIAKFQGNLNANKAQAESMRWLWDVAVRPVLEELRLLWQDEPPSILPCVWWVGGGLMALLPLHAAGEHWLGSTDNTLSHVVSSYAPTLKVLQFSQRKSWTTQEQRPLLLPPLPLQRIIAYTCSHNNPSKCNGLSPRRDRQ